MDMRPIALSNVIYKIFSKAIANKLKRLLPMIVNESQSAFVEGRLITDNVFIVFEVSHYLKRKRKFSYFSFKNLFLFVLIVLV